MNADQIRRTHGKLVDNFGLYENVIDAAGAYDAKVDPAANCSLAAHVLNAVTVAVNTFLYEAVGDEESVTDYTEEIKVLAAATALHDTDKYVREAYGFDAEGNTEEVFDQYFDPDVEGEDGDDFGIETFLDGEYRTDLLYIVQRTEQGDVSEETEGADVEFPGLERYSRIGDRAASKALERGVDGVCEELASKLGEEHVHRLEFTALEQPILNDVLLGTVKRAVAGELGDEARGVVVGSSPDTVVHLGDRIDGGWLRETVTEAVPRRITNEFNFDCKLTWNSFDYDILAEIALGIERKESTIADAFRGLLERGAAGVEPFEHVPPAFDEYAPILAKAIYVDGRSSFDDDTVQAAYDRIYDEQGPQKVKLHFVAYLAQHCEEHAGFLDELAEELRPALHEDLEPEVDAISTAIDRFFDGGPVPELTAKANTCFLCGARGDEAYQKGRAGLYRTQAYSRRVPPHAKYKTICAVCNLEYALLASVCENSGVATSNEVEVAYFYMDEFLGDVRVRKRRSGNLVQDDADEFDDTAVTKEVLGHQYYLQPVYVLNENHRLAVVRQVMETAADSGMKVVLGRPFTRFDAVDEVFRDEEATRPQQLLGLEDADRFGPVPSFAADDTSQSHLRRARQLFDLLATVGGLAGIDNQYTQVDRDEFHALADHAVRNVDAPSKLDTLRTYLDTYHRDALMDMRTVAERGIDLFGKQFDSKYKKTKVFREAIDAFLAAKSQQMEGASLHEYVESQVYAAADREDYAGNATPAEAEAFVEAIQSYLDERNLDDLKKLSDWEDALVNSYYYAYQRALADRQ